MKRRLAQLPLHSGKAPGWLFQRMTRLAGAVTMAIVDEYGQGEMLARLADPWWFQAFGCALGFDWHSSGVTTVTCGALKEARKRFGGEMGIHVAGGKGGVSRRTPVEIAMAAEREAIGSGERLVYASRLSAKVDSAALQDGFELYHHCFFFTSEGAWCVVQQGMNTESRWARRYHWLGESVNDFVCEPHAAIHNLAAAEPAAAAATPARQLTLFNMVAKEAEANRQGSAALVRQNPDWLIAQIERYTQGPTLFAPARHRVLPSDTNIKRLKKKLTSAHEAQPQDFQTLLGTQGIGPSTIRSLSLLAELIYEAPTCHRDPGRQAGNELPQADIPRWPDYSYAHGGKDGTPFPVDRDTYDRSIAILTEAIRKSRVGENEKVNALKRLARNAASFTGKGKPPRLEPSEPPGPDW